MIMNGPEWEYYDNGQLKSECVYVNDVLNGPVKYYYPNGTIENEGTYLNNVIVNESKVYHNNETLKFYVVNDLEGNTRYHREYSETGKLVEEKGNGIGYVKYNIDNKNLHVGDELVGKYFVATPPHTICAFKILGDSKSELPIVNNYAVSKYKCIRSGTYEIVAILNIKDEIFNKIKNDTLKTQLIIHK